MKLFLNQKTIDALNKLKATEKELDYIAMNIASLVYQAIMREIKIEVKKECLK